MAFKSNPAAIHFEGANGGRIIDAEHYVRSERGNWVTVWETHEGQSDMKIPRERVVMIEPREKAEKDSVKHMKEAEKEVKA